MVKDFASTLISWFLEHARDLPWRDTNDPYCIWVSEVILQQTRVAQGLGYYQRFISRFPSVQALAEAPLDDVMKLWQGLGYYTRARNLHKGAQMVMREFGGKIPSTYAQLIKIPGLGPYAAGAVASFAFKEAVPAIDGNVYRVISRVFGVFEATDSTVGKKTFRAITIELMDKSRPDLFNQALLDFGATQCTPGKPNCLPCPFFNGCYAQCNNMQSALPTKQRSVKLRTRYLHFLMIRWHGSTFIELRQKKDIWHSLYQFPLVETDRRVAPKKLLERKEVKDIIGNEFTLLHVSEERRQLLSHQELFARFYIVEPKSLPYQTEENYQRVDIKTMSSYQVPVMIGNYLAAEDAAEYFAQEGDT